jgi:hypothetical protein
MSWTESWTGGEQVRFFKIEERTLTITTAVDKNPKHGRCVVVFTKTP